MRYELVGMSVVAALLCVVIPIALAIVLRRRLGVRIWIFVLGALTFIASQVVHIPLMIGVDAAVKAWLPPPPPSWVWLTPLLLGFLAGVCEEPARWLALRFAIRRDEERGREGAVMLGAGHGGVEAMFIGLSVLLSLVNLVVLREVDVAGLVALSGGAIDEAAATTAVEQVRRYWAQPTWEPLLATVERVLAIALHVSMSALVAHGVRRRVLWPLAVAIAWHTVANAVAVYGVQRWSPVMVELALAAMIVPVAVLLLTWTWRRAGPTLVRAAASPESEDRPS